MNGESLSFEVTPSMLILVPLVAALIQVIKRLPIIAKISDWLPLVSVAIATGLAMVNKMPNPIMAGVVIGLTAVGGYELIKKPTPPTP